MDAPQHVTSLSSPALVPSRRAGGPEAERPVPYSRAFARAPRGPRRRAAPARCLGRACDPMRGEGIKYIRVKEAPAGAHSTLLNRSLFSAFFYPILGGGENGDGKMQMGRKLCRVCGGSPGPLQIAISYAGAEVFPM